MAKNFHKGKVVACLDMGSSKLMCLIAAVDNDEIKILGYSHKESRGIVGGAISDMRLAQKSITNAVSEAERMAGLNIERLLISLSGSQVASHRKEESVRIASEMVKSTDISHLAGKVRTEFRKNNREMIHLIPLQYRIDDCSPVQNPRYMSGHKLYARFHTVSTSHTTIRNIENCLRRCQLSIDNYVIEPYASALACLSENEMMVGSLIVDIGGDVTSFCLIMECKMVYCGHIPIGGNHITKDIATILNVNFNTAEKIKSLNSSLIISPLEEREIIKLKSGENEGHGFVTITRSELRDIIKSRLDEILESSRAMIEKSGVPSFLINNVVLTGGVTGIIGIDKAASEIFDKHARIGYPNQMEEIPSELAFPSYACCLGMIIFLRNLYLKEKIKDGFESKNNWFRRVIERLVAV